MSLFLVLNVSQPVNGDFSPLRTNEKDCIRAVRTLECGSIPLPGMLVLNRLSGGSLGGPPLKLIAQQTVAENICP